MGASLLVQGDAIGRQEPWREQLIGLYGKRLAEKQKSLLKNE